MWAEEARKGDLHITIKCTCKLLVTVSSTTKPGDDFPVRLEDEDTACFIVHYNDVSITIHRNTFRAHELSRPNFGLKGKTQNRKICWHERNKVEQFKDCITGTQWDGETFLSSKVSQREVRFFYQLLLCMLWFFLQLNIKTAFCMSFLEWRICHLSNWVQIYNSWETQPSDLYVLINYSICQKPSQMAAQPALVYQWDRQTATKDFCLLLHTIPESNDHLVMDGETCL